MAVEIKINVIETTVPGEVDTYQMTLKVVNAVDIDPEIFIVERTCPGLNPKRAVETFHHVAYLPEMDTIGTTVLPNTTHQYIRKSNITRTYPTLNRMNESRKVMLADVKALVRTANQLGNVKRETDIIIKEDASDSTIIRDDIYTFDGEIVNF
jgi:hypothetical protein